MGQMQGAKWGNKTHGEFVARVGRAAALILAGLVSLAIAACGSPEVQALRFGPAPWQDGETSTYRITDRDGANAGTARYAMTALGENGWQINRNVQAQNAQELVGVTVDAADFTPSAATQVRIEPDGVLRLTAAYTDGQASLEITNKLDMKSFERVNVPSDTRDERTVAMLVRALPLAQGYAARLNSFTPIVPLLERVTVSVVKQEEVETPAGTFDAWQVKLDTGEIESRVWIAVDPPHALVKMEDGRTGGTFELTEFQPGG
jgi:hypothetical protein